MDVGDDHEQRGPLNRAAPADQERREGEDNQDLGPPAQERAATLIAARAGHPKSLERPPVVKLPELNLTVVTHLQGHRVRPTKGARPGRSPTPGPQTRARTTFRAPLRRSTSLLAAIPGLAIPPSASPPVTA